MSRSREPYYALGKADTRALQRHAPQAVVHVYLALIARTNARGEATTSVKEICREIRISSVTFRRACRALRAARLIDITRQYDKETGRQLWNRYTLLPFAGADLSQLDPVYRGQPNHAVETPEAATPPEQSAPVANVDSSPDNETAGGYLQRVTDRIEQETEHQGKLRIVAETYQDLFAASPPYPRLAALLKKHGGANLVRALMRASVNGAGKPIDYVSKTLYAQASGPSGKPGWHPNGYRTGIEDTDLTYYELMHKYGPSSPRVAMHPDALSPSKSAAKAAYANIEQRYGGGSPS